MLVCLLSGCQMGEETMVPEPNALPSNLTVEITPRIETRSPDGDYLVVAVKVINAYSAPRPEGELWWTPEEKTRLAKDRVWWTPRKLARTVSWDFRLDGKHLFPCRNLERYEQVDSSQLKDEDTFFVRLGSPEESERLFRLSDYDLPQGPHTYSIRLETDMAPPSVREKHPDVLQGHVCSNTATFTYAPPPGD